MYGEKRRDGKVPGVEASLRAQLDESNSAREALALQVFKLAASLAL